MQFMVALAQEEMLYCAEMSITQKFRKTLKMSNILLAGFTCEI